MNVLVAPNALKGSLSASDAGRIISRAIQDIVPDAQTILCPISDGGNGTLDCLVQATHGKFYSASVCGPLGSMKVNARWGILGDGTTAMIEMAEAAGLHLLKQSQLDVAHATTFGVGQLMQEAIKFGCKKILIGMGGSATNDGGAGCAKALGVKFFDENNVELPDGGIHLSRLRKIEIKNEELIIKNIEVIGLSDVINILCGTEGAAFTFAPQKGGSERQVRLLDDALKNYASIIEGTLHRDVSLIPGSGAAGGLGAGLLAFCNARILPGIGFVLDTLRFDDLLDQCDCVITAEGMLDSQTLRGKGIEGITRRARKLGKPVHAFAGRIAGDKSMLQHQLGLTTLHQISPDGLPIDEAIRNAKSLLFDGVKDFFSANAPNDTKK